MIAVLVVSIGAMLMDWQRNDLATGSIIKREAPLLRS